jgi:hypothetical protein
MFAIIGRFLSAAWAKLALVGVGIAAALAVYAAVRKSGRDAQRADDAIDTLDRTKRANKARVEGERPITPKEEADDLFNRDRR